MTGEKFPPQRQIWRRARRIPRDCGHADLPRCSRTLPFLTAECPRRLLARAVPRGRLGKNWKPKVGEELAHRLDVSMCNGCMRRGNRKRDTSDHATPTLHVPISKAATVASSSTPHTWPPKVASDTPPRVRRCLPPPHEALHWVHEVNAESTQSVGHGCALHVVEILAASQYLPPNVG